MFSEQTVMRSEKRLVLSGPGASAAVLTAFVSGSLTATTPPITLDGRFDDDLTIGLFGLVLGAGVRGIQKSEILWGRLNPAGALMTTLFLDSCLEKFKRK